MVDLRERLQELADAATRDGTTPGPAHAIRRGRRRRGRIAAGVAVLLAAVLAAGAAGAGRLGGGPAGPAIAPATTAPPARPGRLPSTEEMAFDDLSRELSRCRGGGPGPAERLATVRSRRWRQVWMAAARPPAPGTTRFCRTAGLFSGGGAGVSHGAASAEPAFTLTAGGTNTARYGTIEGEVTKRAALVRVRFRDGRRPLDVAVIRTAARYPVNLYVAFFPGSGSEEIWPATDVTAVDAGGRTIATCSVESPRNTKSSCPAR
jgi:hypothetical protein